LARSGRVLRATLHYGKKVVPFLISFGLVTWLIWKVTPEKLLVVLSTSSWPWLLLATVAQLVVLFLWDTLNLWWLFSQPHPEHRPTFRTVLRARTDSIQWSAINLEIGQGVFAYKVAKAIGEPITEALGRFFVLALFDFGTLQSLGLIGSFLVTNPLIATLRWVCVASTVGLLALALILHFLPAAWRQWLEGKNWGRWLKWWSWRHSLLLWAQRLTMFLLVILYAWVGLLIIGIHPDARTVFGTIPFVLVAEALPGTGGLGERETALIYLLNPGGKEAELLAFGLIWSTVVIVGRVLIGLVSSWLPHAKEEAERVDESSAARPSSGSTAA
jgi:uncharacterized membrane protein YbhN (UPF0104 family)